MKPTPVVACVVCAVVACSANNHHEAATSSAGGASASSSAATAASVVSSSASSHASASTDAATSGSSSSGTGGAGGASFVCRPTTAVEYSGPGPDADWGTPDDVIGTRSTSTYQPSGWLDVTLLYDAPGPDGVWGTADDQLKGKTVCKGDLANHVNTCVYQQASGSPYGYRRSHYDAANQLLLDATLLSPGPDHSLMTADDETTASIQYTWQSGQSVASKSSKGPGPDGQWGTPDDPWQAREIFLYLPSGKLVAIVKADSPGADNVWDTGDDSFSSAVETTCSGPDTLEVLHAGFPGPDASWGTADDFLKPTRTILTGDGCDLTCIPPLE